MRRLSKLIPRSTGGRWAAGLGLAGVVAVGIYLVFFVFAFHLIFVDEVVDEEAPEFASEADIDELISEALDTAATAGVAQTADSDKEATDQPMSVGEHEVDPSGDADRSDSAGAAEGSLTGSDAGLSDGAESGEADSSASAGSNATSSGEGQDETGGSDASGTADGSDSGATADDSGGGTAGQADGQDRSDSSTGSGSTTGDDGAAGSEGSGQDDDGGTGSGSSGQDDDGSQAGGGQGDGDSGDSGDSDGDQGDGSVRVSHVGSFGPRSHPAEGAAVVLTDGTQTVLRFDDSFATDNGPDLNVYLHTAGPDASVDDLVADFIDLGDLKGNIGAQNYVVPDSIDLNRYSTVSVWCVRFRVVFGTAELMPMN